MHRRTVLAAGAAAVFSGLASPALAALAVGAKAPDFSLPGFKAGAPVTLSLAAARKQGAVVVYFFPAAFTGGCDLEARLFAEAADEFAAHGASIIGITAGNLDRLKEFSADNKRCSGKFPVAADAGAKVARTWGNMHNDTLSNRTSYVIAPNGKVLFVHSDLNPNEHIKLALEAVKTWKGGKKT